MHLSVVIPAYNEQDSVEELGGEVIEVLARLGGEFEIIFVDDGSTDGTVDRVHRIRERDARVRLVGFPRNFGKSAAYSAGFDHARGDVIVTLDADLQDDPAEIPKLLERLDDQYDLVVGWKMGRLRNEPSKTLPSRVFNWFKGRLFGLQLRDSNCGFRAMRAEVARNLRLHGDTYRFIPELAHQLGFRVTEEGVNHRPRKYGRSKYGVRRFWTGLLDLASVRFTTAFVQKPLHFFGSMGLVPIVLGGGLEVYVLVCKLLGEPFRQHVAAIIIGALLITVGVQLIATGLIGEILVLHRPRRDYVLVRSSDDDARGGGERRSEPKMRKGDDGRPGEDRDVQLQEASDA